MILTFPAEYIRALERVFRRILPLLSVTEFARAATTWHTNELDAVLNAGIGTASLVAFVLLLRHPAHALGIIRGVFFALSVFGMAFSLFGFALMPPELTPAHTAYVLTGKYIYIPFAMMLCAWLTFPGEQARRLALGLYVANVIVSVAGGVFAFTRGESDANGLVNLTLHHALVGGSYYLLLQVLTSVYARQFRLEQERHALERYAYVDALTGLANRRALEDALMREVEDARAARAPLSVVLFDVDHFKRVNDTLGHDTGDTVLKDLARVARAEVRGTDLLARWGGEEFMLLLPGTEPGVAAQCAERVRRAVEAHAFLAPDVTVSLGVATLHPGEDARVLVRRADDALYDAKRAGRNRVRHAVEPAPPGVV